MPIIWNQSKRKQDVASKCHIVKIVNSNQNLINNSTSPIQSIPKKQFSMQCQTVCSGMQVTVQIKGKWIQCLIYQPASWKRLSISLANSSRSERNSLQCSPQGRNQSKLSFLFLHEVVRVDQTVSTVSNALGYYTFNEFAIFPTFHTLSSNFKVRLYVCNIATIMYHLYRAEKTLLPTR